MLETVSTPNGLDAKLAGIGKLLAFYDTLSGEEELANEWIVEGWLPQSDQGLLDCQWRGLL